MNCQFANIALCGAQGVMLRNTILNELHLGHLGIVKMKKVARSYAWWPGIDKDIEILVKSCDEC